MNEDVAPKNVARHQMKLASLGVGLFALTVCMRGQTAKQGTEANVDPTAFHSPMVLETVFAGNNPSLWMDPESVAPWQTPKPVGAGKWFSVREWYDLGTYTCDGVSLRRNVSMGRWPPGTGSRKGMGQESGLAMRVRSKAGRFEVEVEPAVYNPSLGHDKRVTILVDVLNSERVVMAAHSVIIKAEEGHRDNPGEVTFNLTAEQMQIATKLRLTMTTQDY